MDPPDSASPLEAEETPSPTQYKTTIVPPNKTTSSAAEANCPKRRNVKKTRRNRDERAVDDVSAIWTCGSGIVNG
jgi:hypothetical protein